MKFAEEYAGFLFRNADEPTDFNVTPLEPPIYWSNQWLRLFTFLATAVRLVLANTAIRDGSNSEP